MVKHYKYGLIMLELRKRNPIHPSFLSFMDDPIQNKTKWRVFIMKMTLLVSLLKETQNMEVEFESIEVTEVADTEFNVEVDGQEWLVVDEDSALERMEGHIEETASYFSSLFLSNMTKLPEKVFEALTDENEAVVELIKKTCGMSEFISEAISVDGLGHFLSSYDGNEYELVDGFTAYRQN